MNKCERFGNSLKKSSALRHRSATNVWGKFYQSLKVVLGKAALSDLRKSLKKSVEELQWKITCQISAFPSPYDILISFWLVSDKVKWSKSPTRRKQSKCFCFNDLVSHLQKMLSISLSLKIGNKNKNEQYLFSSEAQSTYLTFRSLAIVNKYLNQSHDAVISPL